MWQTRMDLLLANLKWLSVPGLEGSTLSLRHPRYYRRYICAISDILLMGQLAVTRASPCFALMLDGSADVTKEEHGLQYLRYINLTTFVPMSAFLCAVKLPGKACQVVDRVDRRVFSIFDIEICKLVALSTDGDASMIGQHSGLRHFLRLKNPFILCGRCAAHKSAFVMSDTSKELH